MWQGTMLKGLNKGCPGDKVHYAPTFSLVVNFSKIELTP
jgi:hypothetical protein